MVKDNMKRNVKTGLGITEGIYYQRMDEPTLDGEIQGTADTPLLYSMLSSVAIKAHKSFSPGLTLESPTMTRAIRHHSIAYVDDADGHVSADITSQDPTSEAVTQMHKSAQGWNDVNNLTGGSLAYHKNKMADDQLGINKWNKETERNNPPSTYHQRLDRSTNKHSIRENK